MNPSASGWIEKYGSVVQKNQNAYPNFDTLYSALRKNGFVYGLNADIPHFIRPEHTLSEDEKAKINLLNALYFTYKIEAHSTDYTVFITEVFKFYQILKINKVGFFDKLLTGNKTSSKLEKLMASRIYIEDNIFSKTFNNLITNSLLFIDVLLFKHYLNHAVNLKSKAEEIEYLAINITYHALSSKEAQRKDNKLSQLLASSLTYIECASHTFDGSYRDRLLNNKDIWENRYFLDMACLTVWEDHSLDYTESDFIFGIGKDLGLANAIILESITHVTAFFKLNMHTIHYLKEKNLAHQFYDSMGKIVKKLILRNSKRLVKELSQSAELVSLLSKSTVRDLSNDEKRKVQNQLLDIFKSIPSLAIFILPGGAILLPIFIKLIPKLLPSAFDENRIDDEDFTD
ncbi:LETM1-related biofilm-associated protein [Maribacter confluentis]|uniref:LETM1-related biofilm-associated protein n=1 Tax=Maribacter confluentis TaxID=1656093 RepID=A0ABT8RM74_9FLAO|nr:MULTISPECIES: LETM1-related biofilm-associated protein [Maribacter]MDO1511424.1 LETM1-related biofilm-associated protein [Maribacter confluentis]TVZ14626.1 LETM1-like protein [Maribacter sp. MAR_2009_72]